MLSSSSSLLASCGNNPAKRRKILEEILQDILGRTHFNDLPNEILQDIMSRSISAKHVLRYRSVCRLWKNLTSTQEFNELNCNRNGSYFTVLVEEMFCPVPNTDDFKVRKKLYMFEAWRREKKVINPRRPRLGYYNPYEDIDGYEDDDNDGIIDDPIIDDEGKNIIKPRPSYSYIDPYKDGVDDQSKMYISGSSSGLVVFHHKSRIDKPFSRKFIIMNPFTGDMVKIRAADDATIIGQIFGVFLHPVLKEFCVVWGQTRRPQPRDNNNIIIIVKEYKLLNLGPSQSLWRNIENQSTDYLFKKRQQPRIGTSPIILDDVLYWMVDEQTQLFWPNPKYCEEAILGFNTKTEEFHFLPHPSPCPCRVVGDRLMLHASMHLLQNYNNNNKNGGAGHLSLCQFSEVHAHQSLMSIWIFKKEEILPSSASASYNVNKGSWIKMHTIKLNDRHIIRAPQICLRFDLTPIAMVDDELLLMKLQKLGSLFVWNMKRGTCQRFESNRETTVGGFRRTFMCAHTHTFMPIRNSKPEILLEEL